MNYYIPYVLSDSREEIFPCSRITMPYLLQNNQNRVENIKKKFENSFFDEKDVNNRVKNYTSFTSHSKTNAVEVLKSGNVENDNKLHDGKQSVISEVNKADGKALVRRSPAFRREKLNYGISIKNSVNNNNNLTHEQNLHKSKPHTKVGSSNEASLPNENFSRSSAEIKKVHSTLNFTSDSHVNDSSNAIARPVDNIKQDTDKIISNVSDDVVTRSHESNKCEPRKAVGSSSKTELKLTDSIRLALKAPLPKGPPPKKPPRTFQHTMTAVEAPCGQQESTEVLPIKEDPMLRLKLAKIEKVVKNLESRKHNVICETNKMDIERLLSKMQEPKEASQEKQVDGFCLKNLNCINSRNDMTVSYKKDCERQSCFYTDSVNDGKDCIKTDMKNSYLGGNTISCEVLTKRQDPEPIYDLPFVKKKSFESFGKSSKRDGNVNMPQLHYMCTDVVSSVQDAKPATPLPLNQGDGVIGNFHSESQMKNVFHKLHGIKKNALEFLPFDRKPDTNGFTHERKNVIQKEEMKTVTNDAFDIPNSVNQNSKPVEADSDSESSSSGLDDMLSGRLICNSSVQPAENRKKVDHRHVPVSTTTKDCLISQTTALRKTYVKRVSSKFLNHSPYTKNFSNESFSHLFESCILVGLTFGGESKTTVPYIKSIFPSHVKPPPLIESLCFPDASTWSQSSCIVQQGEQYYSLVITNENGDRKFGYCRRVLPEGGNFCLPLVYCIISLHRANGFYYKVLQELESRHGSSELQTFIEQMYECSFPGPGQSLKLKKILEEVTRVSPVKSNEYLPSTIVRRPCDVRLEERDLSQLLQHLKVSVLLKVFSSLLLERKVLLLGNSLRILSSCIEALQSLLLPFSWQHTFIPVLPNNLTEMCDAPTPYIMGLQKSTIIPEFLSNLNFEEGIMVDLEESNVIRCCGDEGSIIPQRLIKGLKTALNLALNVSLESDNDRNVLISEAFIRFFVELCGNYSQFIVKEPDGKKIFKKEEFINAVPAIQPFLDWFVETAMFRSFIQERLQNDIDDLFKRRTMEHVGESDKNIQLFTKNYKGMNRKVKTLGDRIKDLTLFTK